MNKIDVYVRILRDTVSKTAPIEDALLRAVVLHTHSIALRPEVALEDLQKGDEPHIVLAPLTRTHVAELLAPMWPRSDERGADEFWLEQYNRLTPYEVFADVPGALRARALAARKSIEAHPLVAALVEE